MDVMKKREIGLYAVVWALVFALVPLTMSMSVLSGRDFSFSFKEILNAWAQILPYFLLFLLHNSLAAPFLVKKKWGRYLAVALPLLVLFGVYCFLFDHRPPRMEEMMPPPPMDGIRSAPPGNLRPIQPEVMKQVIGLLVMLANLGVKAFFLNIRNERQVHELQAKQLSQQLETLRYQINPHFFMNTLNNIHALVDIDPEKAKESIEEFSKLMRIVLYDGDAPTIPLAKEADMLKHYVSLMRLRYPESVDISLEVPGECREAEIPPLLLATFVENAFKHGISYESASFVHVRLLVEGERIVFSCCNSAHPSRAAGQHGLGLENVRRRLDLLYGPFYTLDILETQDSYDVQLVLPCQKEESV